MAATVAIPAVADPFEPRHPCAEAIQRCDGSISVPLDWRDPAAGTIEVAFAWLPRRDVGRPATGTVVANPGGPRQALDAIEPITAALGPVLDRQNLLVVEPRGFGRSTTLSCPGVNLDDPASIRACAVSLGERAVHFGTAQAAEDIDAVRRTLGVGPVSFYGNSYGTLLGHAYAARHPDAVRAVFLDSVVGAGRDGYSTLLAIDQVDDGLDNLEVACAPSPDLPEPARRRAGPLDRAGSLAAPAPGPASAARGVAPAHAASRLHPARPGGQCGRGGLPARRSGPAAPAGRRGGPAAWCRLVWLVWRPTGRRVGRFSRLCLRGLGDAI